MDEKDRLLLTYLQKGLSLTPRPFDVWSAKSGADTAEILVRIQRLKKEGIFEGIKAVLDPRAFHYQGAWGAVRCSPEELESQVGVLGRYPGVVYSCERDHEFNLWFFIAAPAGQDLELHVRCLKKLAGGQKTLLLPVRKVFKGIDPLSSLNAEMFPDVKERFGKWKTAESDLTVEEIDMLRQLQEPFPLTDEPYRKIAGDLGITEAQALERIHSLAKKGCLKRIGIFLKPVAVFPSKRALVVWQIPEEKLERLGSEIVNSEEVLYADQRPAFAEFPYSLYTMIRADTPVELEVLTRRMQDRIGKWPCRALVTTREFKREPMKFFPKDLDVWWRENRHVAETAF
jgi:DNA-binding Lrp family transcriptional regulator